MSVSRETSLFVSEKRHCSSVEKRHCRSTITLAPPNAAVGLCLAPWVLVSGYTARTRIICRCRVTERTEERELTSCTSWGLYIIEKAIFLENF